MLNVTKITRMHSYPVIWSAFIHFLTVCMLSSEGIGEPVLAQTLYLLYRCAGSPELSLITYALCTKSRGRVLESIPRG